MKILLCGGFLGSGKTTMLNSILDYLNRQGLSAAVIENEIGEFGIDDLLIREAGVTILDDWSEVEVFGFRLSS